VVNRPLLGRRSRLVNGPGPVVVVIVGAVVAGAFSGGFTDLFVYQHGGRAVLDGLPIYSLPDPVTGLYFSYPPFAAVIMAPLALLPTWLAAAVWTGSWLAALLTVGALALEPVWQNFTFGQINLLLMLAVMIDLVRPEKRWSGLLMGIAAGVKLIPLVFVVLLVLVGRRAAAGRAALAFAGTVAIGFVLEPGSSLTYWDEGLVDARRVGPAALAHNQSVYGALSRLLDGPPPLWLWLATAGPLSLAVLLVGTGWWRRGDRVLGTGLGAVAMLLASPISWSHHWVWAVPIALALWERSRWVCAVWTAVFVARPIIWPPNSRGREYGWSPVEHVVGNAYLLAALTLSAWAAVALYRRAGTPAPLTDTP
jgi:alpha-1,2-mannosyltransferase